MAITAAEASATPRRAPSTPTHTGSLLSPFTTPAAAEPVTPSSASAARVRALSCSTPGPSSDASRTIDFVKITDEELRKLTLEVLVSFFEDFDAAKEGLPQEDIGKRKNTEDLLIRIANALSEQYIPSETPSELRKKIIAVLARKKVIEDSRLATAVAAKIKAASESWSSEGALSDIAISKKNERLEETINKLRTIIAEKESALGNLEASERKLKSDNARLIDEAQDREEAKLKLETQSHAVQQQKEELEKTLSAQKKENETLKLDRDKLKQDLDKVRMELVQNYRRRLPQPKTLIMSPEGNKGNKDKEKSDVLRTQVHNTTIRRMQVDVAIVQKKRELDSLRNLNTMEMLRERCVTLIARLKRAEEDIAMRDQQLAVVLNRKTNRDDSKSLDYLRRLQAAETRANNFKRAADALQSVNSDLLDSLRVSSRQLQSVLRERALVQSTPVAMARSLTAQPVNVHCTGDTLLNSTQQPGSGSRVHLNTS